jgi:hypothetical protein
MNTTLAALIVFGCRCGCVARKDSSSSPPRKSFDRRLEGHDQAGHGFGGEHDALVVAGKLCKRRLRHETPLLNALHQIANDVLRSQSLPGDYCSTRNAFGANSQIWPLQPRSSVAVLVTGRT